MHSHEFDVIRQHLPPPPVASTTAGAANARNSPVARRYPKAPQTRPPSVSSRVIVHSMKTSIPSCTALSWRVRISSRPVRSPMWTKRL